MPVRLEQSSSDFETRFGKLLAARRETLVETDDAVAEIVRAVQSRGDRALIDLTRKFDRVDLQAAGIRYSSDEIEAACAQVPDALVSALERARERIHNYHIRQRPAGELFEDEAGVTLGSKWSAIESVGVYVPGGLASYPSSVLMSTVPARVAGVERIAMVVPAPDGVVNPAVLAAARIAGVSEIYRIGGAQAIAALAFGTETIAPVSKVVGPGNAYVAAAKRQVYGFVGIDMIAGPSEVLIVADQSANPAWIAADLLAQAEHDMSAQSILITPDRTLAGLVEHEVQRQLDLLPRNKIAGPSWNDFGVVIVARDLDSAVALSNQIAPEHLELAVDEPDALLEQVRHAGAIFLGHHTPEAIGDYVGGTNHVLPTARAARYASGLGVYDFVKRISILGCTPDSLSRLGPDAITLAEVEDLQGHARSVSIRLKDHSPQS